MSAGSVPGALLGGVADPRHLDVAQATVTQPRPNFYNNDKITFEEYSHWANISREQENSFKTEGGWIPGLFKRKVMRDATGPSSSPTEGALEKKSDQPLGNEVADNSFAITDSEWSNARGAMRTASWGQYD